MSLANCPRCGKTFNKLPGFKICRDCQDLEEQQFERAYQYLRDNPGAAVPKIARDTEVPERLILEWLRTRRLLAKGKSTQWPCEHCGTVISEGRFCPKCSEELQASFHDLSRTPPQASADEPEARDPRRPDIGHQLRTDKYSR